MQGHWIGEHSVIGSSVHIKHLRKSTKRRNEIEIGRTAARTTVANDRTAIGRAIKMCTILRKGESVLIVAASSTLPETVQSQEGRTISALDRVTIR